MTAGRRLRNALGAELRKRALVGLSAQSGISRNVVHDEVKIDQNQGVMMTSILLES
jgi:hypothetical protein